MGPGVGGKIVFQSHGIGAALSSGHKPLALPGHVRSDVTGVAGARRASRQGEGERERSQMFWSHCERRVGLCVILAPVVALAFHCADLPPAPRATAPRCTSAAPQQRNAPVEQHVSCWWRRDPAP